AHRVERACSDVPEHHAHAGKCRRCQSLRGGVWMSMKGADLPSRAHVSRPWGSLDVSAKATAGKQQTAPEPRSLALLPSTRECPIVITPTRPAKLWPALDQACWPTVRQEPDGGRGRGLPRAVPEAQACSGREGGSSRSCRLG